MDPPVIYLGCSGHILSPFHPNVSHKTVLVQSCPMLREDTGGTIHGAFTKNRHKMEHKREGVKLFALLQELKWKWKRDHLSPLHSQNIFPGGGSLMDQWALPSVLPSLLWVRTQFPTLLRGMCPLKLSIQVSAALHPPCLGKVTFIPSRFHLPLKPAFSADIKKHTPAKSSHLKAGTGELQVNALWCLSPSLCSCLGQPGALIKLNDRSRSRVHPNSGGMKEGDDKKKYNAPHPSCLGERAGAGSPAEAEKRPCIESEGNASG